MATEEETDTKEDEIKREGVEEETEETEEKEEGGKGRIDEEEGKSNSEGEKVAGVTLNLSIIP